ncbi:uncharacterized protein [Periplaneta americana]|uniref:uncharacterized protein isoform X2 n=1 Tax=Periplaneta americana TaxID=6978 RepID=UPI0037E7D3DE
MDVIKKEPEIDPLAIQWCGETDTAEKKHLSEGEISMQCNTSNYDVIWNVKMEESSEPITFPSVKTESEEEKSVQCNTLNCDVKWEVKVEETPEAITFPFTRPCQPEDETIGVITENGEKKLELVRGESEVLTESRAECDQDGT